MSKEKMPHVAVAATLMLAVAATAGAADRLGPEVFGGYSFTRLEDASGHGWNAAVAFDLLAPLGLKLDASGHYGSAFGTDRRDLTLMAGPLFRRRAGRASFFMHVVAGLYREEASLKVFEVTISESESRFGFLAGGGVEVRFSRRLALRLGADYLWSQADGGGGSGLRASAGVVFRRASSPSLAGGSAP